MPWVPRQVVDWFHISKDSVTKLEKDNSILSAENTLLHRQLTVANSNFDWLKQRVFALETERAQLIKKAYGIDVPVPEIVRQSPKDALQLTAAIFEDVGEEQARELGFPAYGPLSAKTS